MRLNNEKDTFTSYHPVVNMLYFSVVIGFSMFFMHPVCLVISLICAFLYSLYVNGKKAMRFGLIFMLPMLIFTALINPAFNHQGVTILTYFPSGNPLTLESILYGIAAAVMLITVVAWFISFNTVMTSDKFVYLFGRVIPALALILAMALRFIPHFRKQFRVISNAQKCIRRDASGGNILLKVKHNARILSIMVTWALENAIETADSMRSRGYGLPGRSAFSIFRFDKRDNHALAYILSCTCFVIAGTAAGANRFSYFPMVSGKWGEPFTIAVFAAYFALCIFPMIINIKEDLAWRSIVSKT